MRGDASTTSARRLVVLSNLPCDRRTERFANTFDRDSIEDLLKEPGDDHPDRLSAGEPARLRIEDQFFIDAAAGAAVRASHVIGIDLKTRNRIGSRCIAEHEVVIALITIGLLGAFVDFDHSSPYGPRSILQNRLVKEVACAMRCHVVLEGVED